MESFWWHEGATHKGQSRETGESPNSPLTPTCFAGAAMRTLADFLQVSTPADGLTFEGSALTGIPFSFTGKCPRQSRRIMRHKKADRRNGYASERDEFTARRPDHEPNQDESDEACPI